MSILEHGMPMSDPLVLETVEEHKTMTRRVVVPGPSDNVAVLKEHSSEPGYFVPYVADGRMANGNLGYRENDCGYRSPYGGVGDLLYIRQAWRMTGDLLVNPTLHCRADGAEVLWLPENLPRGHDGALLPSLSHTTWMPGRFMPKAFARNWVQITGLRAERVQAITDADCEAEGVRPSVDGTGADWRADENGWHRTFRQLWDKLNGPRGYGWDLDPWVWVILYRLVSTTGRDAALVAIAPRRSCPACRGSGIYTYGAGPSLGHSEQCAHCLGKGTIKGVAA